MDNRPKSYDDGIDEANVILKTFTTQDRTLDSHVFGSVGLKQIDFRSPEVKPLMRVKKVETKKDAFSYALDKLRVMFDIGYQEGDFQKLKMYNLNPDQLLCLLQSRNFTEGVAPTEKVIECLEHLRKSKSIRLYKEREEVMSTVHSLALNHQRLS